MNVHVSKEQTVNKALRCALHNGTSLEEQALLLVIECAERGWLFTMTENVGRVAPWPGRFTPYM